MWTFFFTIYKDDLRHQNYKNEHLTNTQRNRILKAKNCCLEWEKDFRELKDREIKNKREIEELYFKPIIASIDDMNKFEEKQT